MTASEGSCKLQGQVAESACAVDHSTTKQERMRRIEGANLHLSRHLKPL